MEKLEKQYLEIKEMADRLESLRCQLWRSEEHRKCVDEEDFHYVDEKMFSLQSQLRELAEFCSIGFDIIY